MSKSNKNDKPQKGNKPKLFSAPKPMGSAANDSNSMKIEFENLLKGILSERDLNANRPLNYVDSQAMRSDIIYGLEPILQPTEKAINDTIIFLEKAEENLNLAKTQVALPSTANLYNQYMRIGLGYMSGRVLVVDELRTDLTTPGEKDNQVQSYLKLVRARVEKLTNYIKISYDRTNELNENILAACLAEDMRSSQKKSEEKKEYQFETVIIPLALRERFIYAAYVYDRYMLGIDDLTPVNAYRSGMSSIFKESRRSTSVNLFLRCESAVGIGPSVAPEEYMSSYLIYNLTLRYKSNPKPFDDEGIAKLLQDVSENIL